MRGRLSAAFLTVCSSQDGVASYSHCKDGVASYSHCNNLVATIYDHTTAHWSCKPALVERTSLVSIGLQSSLWLVAASS